MYFYDAIAPIVAAESIDWERAFFASRWGRDAARRRDADKTALRAATPASATTSTAR